MGKLNIVIINISLNLVYEGKNIPFIIPNLIFISWLFENHTRLNITFLTEKNNVEFALASIKPY